jgi:phosphatidylinositol glycan class M
LSSQQPSDAGFRIESLAFLPQILLSLIVMPLLLARKDLASTMLAQTFAFVTFNKVCTSQVNLADAIHLASLTSKQYFLWYMVFLPFYLPTSLLLRRPALGTTALVLWIVGQALWLQQGYNLEFLGKSTAFFLINCWILGLIVADIRAGGAGAKQSQAASQKEKKTR